MDDLVRDIHDTIACWRNQALPVADAGNDRALVTKAGSLRFTVRFPNRSFSQPALALEQAHGFAGIAGHYNLPQGLDACALQTYVQVLHHAQLRGNLDEGQRRDRLAEVYAAVAARNPALADIDMDQGNAGHLHDVLMGIASAFHVRDINCFLRWDAENPALAGKVEEISAVVRLDWIPSPETLDMLQHQIERRAKPVPVHLVVGAGI